MKGKQGLQSHYLRLKPSTFITASVYNDDRIVKYMILVEDSDFGAPVCLSKIPIEGMIPKSKEFTVELSTFEDRVSMIRIHKEKRFLLLSSEHHLSIFNFHDLSCIWDLRNHFSIPFSNQFTPLYITGTDFIYPSHHSHNKHSSKLDDKVSDESYNFMVGFGSKNIDFRYIRSISIFEVLTGQTNSRSISIPKKVDPVSLVYCSSSSMFVALDFSTNEMIVLKQAMVTDYSGAMYPSGFKTMKEVQPYIEREDEFDRAILNNSTYEKSTSESMDTSITEDDIDIFTTDKRSEKTKTKLTFNLNNYDMFLKINKKCRDDTITDATMNDIDSKIRSVDRVSDSNSYNKTRKIRIDSFMPVPRNVKTGLYMDKISKERKIGEDIEYKRKAAAIR